MFVRKMFVRKMFVRKMFARKMFARKCSLGKKILLVKIARSAEKFSTFWPVVTTFYPNSRGSVPIERSAAFALWRRGGLGTGRL